MYDSKFVQILNRCSNLCCQVFSSSFFDLKIFLFQIVKHVWPFQVFHYNEPLLIILKDIKNFDDVWMLTNFHNLNFSALHLHFSSCKVFLIHNFDCTFSTILDVFSKFHFSKFSFSQCFLAIKQSVYSNFIKLFNVIETNCFLNMKYPICFILLFPLDHVILPHLSRRMSELYLGKRG